MQASQTVGVITLESSTENAPHHRSDLTLESTFHRLVATSDFDSDNNDFHRIGINRVFDRFQQAPGETIIYAHVHELANELIEEFDSLRQRVNV